MLQLINTSALCPSRRPQTTRMAEKKAKEDGSKEGANKDAAQKVDAKQEGDAKKDSRPEAPKWAHPASHHGTPYSAHWPTMPPTSYIIPHPPTHGHHHPTIPAPLPSSHRAESLTFAGAGLVVSLTILTVQLVLSIALGRADLGGLFCSTFLVLACLWAVGSYGKNASSAKRQGVLAKMICAIRAALAALEAFHSSMPEEPPKPPSCAPPYLLATPCWPPSPCPPVEPAPPAPAAEKPKPEKPAEKQPSPPPSKLDGAVQTGGTKKEEAKKKTEEEEKKKKEQERLQRDESEVSLLSTLFIRYLNQPPDNLRPPQAPSAPAPAKNGEKKKDEEEEKKKPPPEQKEPEPPKVLKPKPPPGQPKPCYKDGRTRTRTWFSRDAVCWGTVECNCGCSKKA